MASGESLGSSEGSLGGVLEGCEAVLAEHDALGRCVSIEPRRLEDQHADLHLRFGDRAWLRSADGEALVEAFRGHASVAEVQQRRSDLLLRFDDAFLAGLEQRLALGESAGMGADDILAGSRCIVSLVGPNANKALHVGHLRNVFLGQALVAALTAAGADVRRHSLVADIGRRICEAMGGYLERYDGEDPESMGLPGDRFVELCSGVFRDQLAQSGPRSTTGPNAQEDKVCGDLAEEIMQAWLLGGQREQELSGRMRNWVLTSHERTLARLGVRIDKYDFESDEIPRAFDLVAKGLERGLFEREESGGVVYRTGRPEYATMVLLNESGAPTECARVLATCHRMIEDLDPNCSFLEVLGDEWQPAQTVVEDLLVELLPCHDEKSYEWIYYGLVTAAGQKIGSSVGGVVWIDDLLDELIASPSVAALYELGQGGVEREEIADLIVRGTFLCAPMAQPLPFDTERLCQSESGPGWTIAAAWCLANLPTKPIGEVPVARTAIVQAQQFRRLLQRIIEQRDPVGLATYLTRLSEAFLAAPEVGPAAAPVMRRVLQSIGFPVGDQTAFKPSEPATAPSGQSRSPILVR